MSSNGKPAQPTEAAKSETSVPLFDGLEEAAEKAFGVEFGRFHNLNVYCPFCEDEESSNSPSCSVSRSGLFHCKSCKRSGTAAAFYAQKRRIPTRQAKQELNVPLGAGIRAKPKKAQGRPRKKVRPLTDDVVIRCHKILMRSTIEISYLIMKRGLSQEAIERYQLGIDETRFTVPIRFEDGSLYGLRRYKASHGKQPKWVSHEGGGSAPMLFPMERFEEYREGKHRFVIVCEGEFDCMLLTDLGYAAATVTSGVSVWEPQFTEQLASLGKPIVIVYDVNDKDDDLGQRVARERAKLLHNSGLEVKVVRLPLPTTYVGGDVTNWFIDEKHTAEEFNTLIEEQPWFDGTEETVPQAPAVASEDAPLLTLHEASQSQYFFKAIRLRCLVAGRRSSPYLLPAKIQVDMVDEEGNTRTAEHAFNPWDGVILSLIRCSTVAQHRYIKALLNIPANTAVTITVLESLNVEEIFLIPAIDHEVDQGPYVMRTCYYVGHGLKTNQVYDFEGYTLPDPRTQEATHILTKASPTHTDLEDFDLSPSLVETLKERFQAEDVFEKVDDVASQLASHVTHIYGRSDLHIAVDLVLHSPLSFNFAGQMVRKGWLEALILGDTRTGKGYVAEGLTRYYGVGETVSAENMSFAGLIAAVQKVGGEQWTLVWGKIPLADRRALVLDEASNLSYSDISKLSRIRSEGVAEVTKAISEKTAARVRLIWLANPRPDPTGRPKKMENFTYGVQAVNELIGATEDVARFDFVLTVAHNEVPSEVINQLRSEDLGDMPYPSDLCRKLIVWIWSRKPEQVIFSDEVVEYTLMAAKDLGKKFSPSICLIQSEDVRYKLARIAAAAAGRTFSTEDGVNLIVTKAHVEFAYNFLYHIYQKPSCGYMQMSAVERERSTLRDPKAVLLVLQDAGDLVGDLVDGLLENNDISARDICDHAMVDIMVARNIISGLVRERALIKSYKHYKKKPAFKRFLQELKMRITRDPYNLTSVDEEFVREFTTDGDQHDQFNNTADVSTNDQDHTPD